MFFQSRKGLQHFYASLSCLVPVHSHAYKHRRLLPPVPPTQTRTTNPSSTHRIYLSLLLNLQLAGIFKPDGWRSQSPATFLRIDRPRSSLVSLFSSEALSTPSYPFPLIRHLRTGPPRYRLSCSQSKHGAFLAIPSTTTSIPSALFHLPPPQSLVSSIK